MRLHVIALALLPVIFLIAKVDASANATASPAPLEISSSAGDRPDTLVSEPQYAEAEERFPVIEEVGWGNKYAALLAKSTHAVWNHNANSHLELKVAWWRVKNVHPYSVFTKLKLDEVDEDILSNSKFRLWVKYVDSYKLEHPTKKVSIIKKLQNKLDEYDLAMMLEQAKRDADPSLKNLGAKLQIEQMSIWSAEKCTSSRLYNLLQWDPSHPVLLTGHAYAIWNIYLSLYKPGRPMTQLEQLLYTFKDASLPALLIASKRSEKTAVLAKGLQLQLEQVWLRERVTPTLAFKYLMLDETPNDLLKNPELLSWMRYEEMYRKQTGTGVTLNEVIESFLPHTGL